MIKTVCLILLASMIGQNVAFATNPEIFQNNVHSNLTQKIIASARARYESLSSEKQAQVLAKAEKRLEKLVRKLENMSDEKFARRMKLAEKVMNQESASTEPVDATPSEVSDAQDDAKLSEFEESVKDDMATLDDGSRADLNTVSKASLIDAANKSLSTIREASERLSQKDSKKLSRGIAMDPTDKIVISVLFGLGGALMISGIILSSTGILAVIGAPLLGVGIVLVIVAIVYLCEVTPGCRVTTGTRIPGHRVIIYR